MKKIFIKLLLFYIAFTPTNVNCQYINPGIALTFDDYSIENWHKLLPILEKYNAKATFFITHPNTFSKAQQQMIIDLKNANNEIACHGYHHYNAVNFIDTSNIENYLKTEIYSSIQWFDSVLNIQLKSFAYPYGARNTYLDSKLLKYFWVVRGTNYSTSSNLNKITHLSHSGVINGIGIDKGYAHSIKEITSLLTKCKSDSIIQIFYSHTPVDSVTSEYQITYSMLDSILSLTAHLGLSFYTVYETRLPIPEKPIGDTLINNPQFLSNYFTNKNEYSINWKLEPENSGKIQSQQNEASVMWNNFFEGISTISAAAKNRCGQGNYATPLLIHVEKITNISKTENNIEIYPNPSSGKLTIKASDFHKIYAIEIFNTTGKKVYSNSSNQNIYDVYLQNRGLYIAKIHLPNTIVTKSLIIN